ncbi:hypothetical protein KQX54_015573, partial [Cotesia glomerata]
HLGGLCKASSDCINIDDAVCKMNECICERGFFPINRSQCGRGLRIECSSDEDCIIMNSQCIEKKCRCRDGYTQNLEKFCLPKVLGQKCETDSDCSFIQQGKCSPDKICACSLDTFALDNKTCSPLLNTFCQFNECEIEFSDCVDHKCQCKLGYTAISSTQCINSNLLEPCEKNHDCLEPWHFECSKEKKCVCKANNVAFKNSSCLPHLGGICWKNDQCHVNNSRCDDYHCRCKPNFIPVSSNKCEPNFSFLTSR